MSKWLGPIAIAALLLFGNLGGMGPSETILDAIQNTSHAEQSTTIERSSFNGPSLDNGKGNSGSIDRNEVIVPPSVVGYVWDTELRPVPDAEIQAFSKEGSELAHTFSDAMASEGRFTGFYTLRTLPEGEILIRASYSGFSDVKAVRTRSGSCVWQNFTDSILPIHRIGVSSLNTRSSNPLGSLAIYYLDEEIWSEETLLPLVAHISLTGNVTGRMYDGVLLYSGDRLYYNSHSYQGPNMTDFCWYSNSSFELLDVLDNVSGKVRKALSDDILFKVVLTAVYFKYDPNASWSVDRLMEKWLTKGYKNLTLVGFHWGYSEGEIDATYDGINGTSDYIHKFGLELIWSPFFLAPMWPYWRDFGIDHVIMQPNFAYNEYDPWRFEKLSSLLKEGEIHGVNFEISYTRNNDLTIEENANEHLDAAFRFSWWKNKGNLFYQAPDYLNEYAMGGVNVPPSDRPIYDRQYQLLHFSYIKTLEVIDDAYIYERPAMLWHERTGSKAELVLRSDRITMTMAYLRFPRLIPYSFVFSADIVLNVISLEKPCLVTIFIVSQEWNEMNLTWFNRPGSVFPSGLLMLNRTGAVSFTVPRVDPNLSFVLVPQNDQCNSVISSKEGLAPPLLKVGYFEPVDSMIPVSRDAYVSSSFPMINFGNSTCLLAGVNQSANAKAYLLLNSNALPRRWHEPRLFMHGLNSSPKVTLNIARVDNSTWNESGVTWNAQPNGSWKIEKENVSLDINLDLFLNIDPFNETVFTLVLYSPGMSVPDWTLFVSRESDPGPLLLVTLQAFERQF